MITKIKIAYFKARAKSYYLQYLDAMDRVDCGSTFALQCLASVREPALRFDAALDKLAQLGEDVPEARLTREAL